MNKLFSTESCGFFQVLVWKKWKLRLGRIKISRKLFSTVKKHCKVMSRFHMSVKSSRHKYNKQSLQTVSQLNIQKTSQSQQGMLPSSNQMHETWHKHGNSKFQALKKYARPITLQEKTLTSQQGTHTALNFPQSYKIYSNIKSSLCLYIDQKEVSQVNSRYWASLPVWFIPNHHHYQVFRNL